MTSTPSPTASGSTSTTHDHDEVPVQAPEAPDGEAAHVTAAPPVAVPVSVYVEHVTVRAKGIASIVRYGATPPSTVTVDIDGDGFMASDMEASGRACDASSIKISAFTGWSRR